jgi:[lysine-biosynthesis-protein LysW]---L-2-aminoadipate ligase
VHDRDAAEAIVEHKATLGSVQHGVFYVQEYVDKPGRDLRVFVVGDEPICGIIRNSPHWITNTARGGVASRLEITPELADISRRAAVAIGRAGVVGTWNRTNANSGNVLAIDLLECPTRGLLVSEINHTMEFRNSIAPTGVNIPGRIIDHVLATARHATRHEVGHPAGHSVGHSAGHAGVGA